MAVLQWGSSGPDVERLQQRLRELGHLFGAADGAYGALTYAAVRRFQQAAGLTVDGIAGPQTLTALGLADAPPAGSTGAPPPKAGRRAMSLHIGINRVDPARYGGWDGALSGCENDAQTMAAIAAAEGFTVRHLTAPAATGENILLEIRRAAQALTAGDTFLLTYAGHGGQVPDPGGAEETDQQDETWVAYDRQVLDDEMEGAFAEFAAGVAVVVVSDSCHSGTVHRMLPPALSASSDEAALQRAFADLKASFYEELAVARPGPGEPAFAGFPRPVRARGMPSLVAVGAPARVAVGDDGRPAPVYAPEPPTVSRAAAGAPPFATRNVPLPVNQVANELQRDELNRAKSRARGRSAVRARGVLLSGCADNQLSQEVGGAGVFTTALSRVWAGNAFGGTYRDLIARVVGQMGPTQTPQLTTFGTGPEVLVAGTPFDVT
jgi:hypothetical protein